MKTLLIIAHGSLREASNSEVFRLAKKLRERVGTRYQFVSAGFLEMAKPNISAGVKACIDAGATEVDVLPYFLSAGRHVTNDVPAELAAVTKDHPGLTIKILPYVGSSDMMLDLMAEICSVRRDA